MNRNLHARRMVAALIQRTVFLFSFLVAAAVFAEDVASTLRQLADFQKGPKPAALDFAWPHLDSPDAKLREAARLAIQAQPFEQWKGRALEEKAAWASLELIRALAESCPRDQAASLSPHLCEQITTLRLEHMDPPQFLAAVRLTRLVLQRLGPVSEDERRQILDLWTNLPTPREAVAAREQRELLDFLRNLQPRRP